MAAINGTFGGTDVHVAVASFIDWRWEQLNEFYADTLETDGAGMAHRRVCETIDPAFKYIEARGAANARGNAYVRTAPMADRDGQGSAVRLCGRAAVPAIPFSSTRRCPRAGALSATNVHWFYNDPPVPALQTSPPQLEVVTCSIYTRLQMKVMEVVQILGRDDWRLDRQSGSHRQFRHIERSGTVTVAGKLGDDVPRGTPSSIWGKLEGRVSNRHN